MRCPKDKQPCRGQIVDGVKLTTCSICKGVWIEQSEVRNLVGKLNTPNLTRVDELLAKWDVVMHEGTLPKDFWQEATLECPKGHGHMGKHYFAGSTIGIDQCQTCQGFWLDGGELQAIVKEVKPNPLLEAAWQELIREQTKMREQNETMAQSFQADMLMIASLITKPPVLVAAVVANLIKLIFESVIFAEDQPIDQ